MYFIYPSILHILLVGGLEHEFYFSIQLGIMIPIDFHIFQRGGATTSQILFLETPMKPQNSHVIEEHDKRMDSLDFHFTIFSPGLAVC